MKAVIDAALAAARTKPKVTVQRIRPGKEGVQCEAIDVYFDAHDTVERLKECLMDVWAVPLARQLLSFLPLGNAFLGPTALRLETDVRDTLGCSLGKRSLGDAPLWSAQCSQGGVCFLNLTDFSTLLDQEPPAGQGPAKRPSSKSGISLMQLERLLSFVGQHCMPDGRTFGWYDEATWQPLRYESINFYQAVDWVIKPATYDQRCSLAELLQNRSPRVDVPAAASETDTE
ncbi:unnamed protein product, partial [Polarella glacialis]